MVLFTKVTKNYKSPAMRLNEEPVAIETVFYFVSIPIYKRTTINRSKNQIVDSNVSSKKFAIC